jgi:opacity protein-like surface antigen
MTCPVRQLDKDFVMRSLKIFAVAGAVALGVSATASAADLGGPGLPPPPPMDYGNKSIGSGWYLRGDIGVGVQTLGKFEQSDVTIANNARFTSKTSENPIIIGAGAGYRFNNWFRTDVTGEYRVNSSIRATDQFGPPSFLGPVGVATNTYNGNLSSFVGLFNGYIDLGTWNCLTPYIGGGIGFARNKVDGITDQGFQAPLGVGGPGAATFGTAGAATKTNVAWALMAGVGYEVNPNLTLELGYRYLNLGKASSGNLINSVTGQVQGPLKIRDIDSHDIKIGMRWTFGDPNCCGPAAQPIAYAAPPRPMPMVRKY